MSSIMTTVTSVSVAETVYLLATVIRSTSIPNEKRAVLGVCCVAHLIQRVTMMFYFDATVTRDCLTLILIGNIFGLILFRYSVVYLYTTVCLSLRKHDAVAKLVAGVTHALFLASSALLLINVVTAPLTDPAVCGQHLDPFYTLANNWTFVLSVVLSVAPVLHVLRGLSRSPASTNAVRRIYRLQFLASVSFIAAFASLAVGQIFITHFPWLMLAFITSDLIYLNGCVLWMLPRGEGPAATAKTSAMPPVTTLPASRA